MENPYHQFFETTLRLNSATTSTPKKQKRVLRIQELLDLLIRCQVSERLMLCLAKCGLGLINQVLALINKLDMTAQVFISRSYTLSESRDINHVKCNNDSKLPSYILLELYNSTYKFDFATLVSSNLHSTL